MKKLITLLLLIASFSVMGQSTNNTPFRFTSGLGFPITATAPFAGAGFGWWQPSTLKLAVYNGTVWQNLLTETLAGTTYQPIITPGTTAQYRRGDMTWQTLNTSVVPEGTGLYFSQSRVLATFLTGFSIGPNTSIGAGDNITGAFNKTQGQINAKQNLITLTTTGTSGAATFNQSTGALNIPQYSGGGSSYTFSNGLTNVSSSVTLGGDIVSPTVLGLTGTNSINISGGTGVSNSGFFNIGAGSGSTNIIGYASSGSARSIAFSNTAMTVSDAISSKGLVYAGNYGANFTDLSLITKKYADSIVAASGGGSSPWSRNAGTATISPTTANDKVAITGAISGFALDVSTSTGGQTAIRATAPSGGNAILAQGGSSGIGLRGTSSGTTVNDAALQATNSSTGPVALFGNSGGTRATIGNDGSYTTQGDVESTTIGNGFILKSPNGTRWRITVSDAGVLTTTSIP